MLLGLRRSAMRPRLRRVAGRRGGVEGRCVGSWWRGHVPLGRVSCIHPEASHPPGLRYPATKRRQFGDLRCSAEAEGTRLTQAASQASIFFERVAKEGRVFTFLDDGYFLTFEVPGGTVVPYWSGRTRLVTVQKKHPKYRAFSIEEESLEEFLGRTLPRLRAETVRVGVNWSGPRLTGFDYSVEDLLRNLEYWQGRLKSGA